MLYGVLDEYYPVDVILCDVDHQVLEKIVL